MCWARVSARRPVAALEVKLDCLSDEPLHFLFRPTRGYDSGEVGYVCAPASPRFFVNYDMIHRFNPACFITLANLIPLQLQNSELSDACA